MAKIEPHQTFYIRVRLPLARRLRKDAEKKEQTLNKWIETAIRQRLERERDAALDRGASK